MYNSAYIYYIPIDTNINIKTLCIKIAVYLRKYKYTMFHVLSLYIPKLGTDNYLAYFIPSYIKLKFNV